MASQVQGQFHATLTNGGFRKEGPAEDFWEDGGVGGSYAHLVPQTHLDNSHISTAMKMT